MKKRYKIIFLNQMAGPLFRELAEDVSAKWSPSLLLTGEPNTLACDVPDHLILGKAPGYNKKNYFMRVVSWAHYFVFVFAKLLFMRRSSLLFIVSNPPFLGMLGLFFKLVRRQKYMILVYDIHPDLLVHFGVLRESSLVVRLWRFMNRVVMNHSEGVITLGDKMAKNLGKRFDVKKTVLKEIPVIHNWADVDWIKPLDKQSNPFVKELSLGDKLIVMYSGNLGQTHDLESILEAAKSLKTNTEIVFIIIGDGAKKQLVVDAKNEYALDNLIVLPFLPEDRIPFSLSAADCSIVTMAEGSEGFMVPSKTYYVLAAGTAIIGLCSESCEIAKIIQDDNCGSVVKPGDVKSLVDVILKFYKNPNDLQTCRVNSRHSAEQYYSRANTQKYRDIIAKVMRDS